MTGSNRGRVVPFALSPMRMRAGAMQRVKQGQPVEAVTLLRRAAERDDRPEGWLQLARQLRTMQCYEQAAKILRYAIARGSVCAGTWTELAQCQLALEERDGAVDCLYHALQEDPYDDASRELLCELEDAPVSQEAFRMPHLVRRALAAWQAGDRESAKRKFRRGMKISRMRSPLHMTLALLYIADGDCRTGLNEALRALKRSPGDVQARLIAAAAVHEMGRTRMAYGLLMRLAPDCVTPAQERTFLDVTEKIGAAEARSAFVKQRLARAPWRVPLLRARAQELLQCGDIPQARPLLNTIVQLDPADLRARAQLACPQEVAEGYPRSAVRGWLTLLMERLPQGVSPEELAQSATPLRDALDWCFAQPDGGLQESVLAGIARQDSPQLRAYLRERLVCRGLTEDARNMILVRLAAMGDTDAKPVLVGQRIASAQATSAAVSGRQQEQFFLRMVLMDAARSGHASQMVHFASRLWRVMTAQQRCEAAGEAGYAWVKAIELLYLRIHGLAELEASLRRDMMISPRRVQRIVRRLSARAGFMKGEEQ